MLGSDHDHPRIRGPAQDAHKEGLLVHAWAFKAENENLPQILRKPGELGDLTSEVKDFFQAGLDGASPITPTRPWPPATSSGSAQRPRGLGPFSTTVTSLGRAPGRAAGSRSSPCTTGPARHPAGRSPNAGI